jgi:multidrug efflux pump subunit AcrB
MQLPQGYTLNWQGEKGDQKEALKYIVMYLPVALFLIVLMLLALFKSYRKTLIMFIGLLLAVIGIVPALIFTGAEFGFLAIVGAIGLMGMMIKNGVVLIDEIDRLLKETGDLHKSLVDASLSRVRPVLMASLTTVLGMFPLIFDPFFSSMAVTIMGGLLVGTLIVIIVVPVLYLLFFKNYRVTA